ncbi:MAG: hypothetical protein IJ933_09815 [Bacteroidales bacterium]|nr:hypothetical protein [Bacteroidales bacterium]
MTKEELYALDFNVKTLGECKIPSMLKLSDKKDDSESFNFVSDTDRVLLDGSNNVLLDYMEMQQEPISFEKAGPKQMLYFDHSKTKVAIVTAGGLCPGLNNVIRGLVMQLYRRYNVTNVLASSTD